MKLPGFDGDTLVCPVGSDDSADWKPALAYPPFKKALLASLSAAPAPSMTIASPKATPLPQMPEIPPMAALPPMPVFPPPAPIPLAPAPIPPAPAPIPLAPAKTAACPHCAHANLEEAHFCNSCGARMDGLLEDVSPPAPIDSPKANQAPAFDPFAHLDPLLTYPTEPAPLPPPESPSRPPQPGKMGQLEALEEPVPAASVPSPAPSPAPALAPEPAPAAGAAPVWKRPAVLAAFAGAAVVAAGLAYVMLNKRPPAATVAELTPASAPMEPPKAAQAPMPMPMPEPPKATQLYSTPPVTSSPAIPAPRAPKAKRARKPRPVRAAILAERGGGETLIESRAPEPKPKAAGKRAAKTARAQAKQDVKDPLLESLLTDATQPVAEPATEPAAEAAGQTAAKAPPSIGQRPAAKPAQFSLPGLQRPVSASDRRAPQARAPRPASEEAAPTQIAGLDSAVLAEPGKSPPPPGIEDEPAKSAEGDQLALVQVHEQFDFCAQLLAQGAYGDHYDTCLCKDAREAAPYRGRRGFYVSAKKKEAGSGHLETTAKILSSKIDAGVAKVTARWKSGPDDKGREASQTWKLEDGLWCQAP